MNKAPREITERNIRRFSGGFYDELTENNVCRRLEKRIVDFDYDDNSMVIEFEVRDWMTNPRGILHGGMYAMCADMSSGALSYILSDANAPTVSLNISFLASTQAPDTLVIRARATHLGHTNTHVHTEITSKKTGRLLATTSTVHFVAKKAGSEAST